MSENEITKAKEYNVKLYPFYKMVSWDLLFYYSIIYLFLNQVKGLSTSNILLGDSFYPLFKAMFQIPSVSIVDKLGKRNSVILGNIFIAISILVLFIFSGLSCVILSNLILAAGFTLKGLCETSLLDECITNTEKKRSIFSSIDGKGNSLWYFFDAISAVITGFLFVINPYIPIIVCFTLCIISCILSFKFKPFEEIKSIKPTKEFSEIINNFKQTKYAFKYIFKSNRLRNIILFAAIFQGLLGIRSTLTSSLLTDIGIPEQYFGIIFAILGIFSSISSKFQNVFHNKFRNRTLTFLSITYCLSLIISGFVTVGRLDIKIAIIIVLIMFAVQYIIKGPYYTLISRYLNSFSSPEISTKIYSANALVEGIFRFIITLFASFLLDFTTTSYSLIIIGCLFMAIFILLLDYMKTRVGLKPEEYKKSDIEFNFVK